MAEYQSQEQRDAAEKAAKENKHGGFSLYTALAVGAAQAGQIKDDYNDAPYLSGVEGREFAAPLAKLTGVPRLRAGGRFGPRADSSDKFSALPRVYGSKADAVNAISKASEEFPIPIEGVSPRIGLLTISYVESRWNPEARNPGGADGIFQFMPGTLAETTRQMRAAGLLKGDQVDLDTHARAGAFFAKGNLQWLQRNGHAATLDNLYMTHWFGQGGFNKIARASGHERIGDVLPHLQQVSPKCGKTFLELNGFTSSTTVDDVRGKAFNLMNNARATVTAAIAKHDAEIAKGGFDKLKTDTAATVAAAPSPAVSSAGVVPTPNPGGRKGAVEHLASANGPQMALIPGG